MVSIIDFDQAFSFFLLLVRVGGIIVMFPLFGEMNVPSPVKILLSISISFFFYKVLSPAPVAFESLHILEIILIVLKEFVLAMIIGFVFRMAFFVVISGSEALAQTSGFAASRLFNPQLNQATSVISDLFFFLVILVFFAVDGEVLMLRVIALTFKGIPLGHITLSQSTLEALIGSGSAIFQLAIRLIGPILFCLFIINTGMGIAGRVVPTLNVWAMSFTVTLGATLWLLWLFLPYYVNAIESIFSQTEFMIFDLIGDLGG